MYTVTFFSASKNGGTHSYPQTSLKVHTSKYIVCFVLEALFH